jgi:hypothetical protein
VDGMMKMTKRMVCGAAVAGLATGLLSGCSYRDYESPLQDNFVRYRSMENARREDLPGELSAYKSEQMKLLPHKKQE